ncbi:Protein DENND6A [Quillaja saponaria]|uniref:Protein DENND6A n=1 Tax=Quillaja saponaria TaxID=32244 RepID=A0AAD7LEB1_QUISA|nr:Protein DENND6A [Quillaja saponaria]
MSRSPSFSVKSEISSKLDPESLRQWVVAFCAIRFDLEQGQLVEECYPPGCLTEDEELEIAFSSFPDSVSQHQNRSSIHDCIFLFRFRREPKPPTSNGSYSEITEVDKELSPKSMNKKILNRSTSSNNTANASRYMYGFVFNRQRHDERLKRGGEQKSVVILSHSPYSSLFRPLLQILGPLYFDMGKKALEHIAACVSNWPAPVPGKLMDLPIGNATLKVNLPPSHSLPLESGASFEESASSVAPFLPNNQSIPQGLFHDSDIFGTYRGLLLQLWMLWELLLIGEPILVIAPTPPQCCEAVVSLVSLLAPLLYSVDFRPYFTIHDPEFSHLNSLQDGSSFPPMILGVTNLFFLKALRNIPHVVSVGSPAPNSNRFSLSSRSSTGRIPGKPEGGFGIRQLSLKKFSPSSLLNAVKLRKAGPLCLMSVHKEAIWSTYSATTKPDTAILNRLIDAGMSPRVEESMSVVNNEILRRHFLELTTNFLAPFGPYFRTITPSEGSSPYVEPPPLPPFSADEFLASLSARGPGKFLSKRMTANWLDLYRRFLKGPNFIPWFHRRRGVAEQEQDKLWRQARMKTDIQLLITKMSELEIVDSFNAIERHLHREIQLQESGRASGDSAATCSKLKGDLLEVFNVLPKDMQQLLLSNPQRASLLQGSPELSKLPGQPFIQVGAVSSTSPR